MKINIIYFKKIVNTRVFKDAVFTIFIKEQICFLSNGR